MKENEINIQKKYNFTGNRLQNFNILLNDTLNLLLCLLDIKEKNNNENNNNDISNNNISISISMNINGDTNQSNIFLKEIYQLKIIKDLNILYQYTEDEIKNKIEYFFKIYFYLNIKYIEKQPNNYNNNTQIENENNNNVNNNRDNSDNNINKNDLRNFTINKKFLKFFDGLLISEKFFDVILQSFFPQEKFSNMEICLNRKFVSFVKELVKEEIDFSKYPFISKLLKSLASNCIIFYNEIPEWKLNKIFHPDSLEDN